MALTYDDLKREYDRWAGREIMAEQIFVGAGATDKTWWINTVRGGIDFAPGVTELMPMPPAPLPVLATPSFDTDHAWDMVVLAARASRHE